jgi:hypothetical protein
MVPQLAFAAMHKAAPPDPVAQAGGLVGGFGSLQAVCQWSSATHEESQLAPVPNDVQQCVVAE